MIRKLIPYSLRLFWKQQQRNRSDRRSGVAALFAKSQNALLKNTLESKIVISQPIHPTETSVSKVENLKIAASKIEPVLILPGEVFSFWEIVGKPSKKSGYKYGRNIIGDKLSQDIGGGLCQISGILYHLALLSGLEILERHNHTIDLYSEEERYTPIGTDATVVFGYKDLRFKNNTNSTLSFTFDTKDHLFTGFVYSDKPLIEYHLRFERSDTESHRLVNAYSINPNGVETFLNLSRYRI